MLSPDGGYSGYRGKVWCGREPLNACLAYFQKAPAIKHTRTNTHTHTQTHVHTHNTYTHKQVHTHTYLRHHAVWDSSFPDDACHLITGTAQG